MSKLKIGLDIDEVLANWWDPYKQRFGIPKTDSEITKNCNQKLSRDREFWLNLPVIRRNIGFDPTLYCTKRSCLKTYTKDWLDNNNFPHKPVYQVLYQKANKANYIKGRIDVFVDDSPFNFITMNRSGVPCLLMNTEYNQYLGPILRIDTLDYDEIADAYYLAKELNIFNEFNKSFENKNKI
jgi:hypothetical protein